MLKMYINTKNYMNILTIFKNCFIISLVDLYNFDGQRIYIIVYFLARTGRNLVYITTKSSKIK